MKKELKKSLEILETITKETYDDFVMSIEKKSSTEYNLVVYYLRTKGNKLECVEKEIVKTYTSFFSASQKLISVISLKLEKPKISLEELLVTVGIKK